MIGTYASAVLICAASLLVGRALLSFADRESWSWLEPAVGLGAILTVTGALARAPGHGTTATVGLVGAAGGRSGRRGAAPLRHRRRAAAGAAGGDRRRRGPLHPLPGQRALGTARGRLQQRPRPPPGLGGMAAQRLRPDARARLPAGPARTLGRGRRGAGNRPRAGLPRPALRDRRAHGVDGARRAAGPRRRAARSSPRPSSPPPTSPLPTSPKPPSRRQPRPSSSSPWRSGSTVSAKSTLTPPECGQSRPRR